MCATNYQLQRMGELESTVEEQRRTILEWQRAHGELQHGELQHGELQSSQPSAGGVDEDIINELLEQVAFLKAELDRRHHHHRGHSASPRSPQASEANGERLDLSAVAAAATPPEQLLPSSNNPHRDISQANIIILQQKRYLFFEAVVCFAYAAYSDGVGD